MFDLIPWRRTNLEISPERSAVDLWREMDNLVDRFLGDQRWTEWRTPQAFAPALDIVENDDEFVVKADLPGVDPKDVEISLTDNLLTIKGEKKHEHEENGDNYHRVERSFGTFTRSFRIPSEVQEDKVKAEYKNGVLDLRLPKSEGAKKKSVKIEVKQA